MKVNAKVIVSFFLASVEKREAERLSGSPSCCDQVAESPAKVTTGVCNWFWTGGKTEPGLCDRASSGNTGVGGHLCGGTLALTLGTRSTLSSVTN